MSDFNLNRDRKLFIIFYPESESHSFVHRNSAEIEFVPIVMDRNQNLYIWTQSGYRETHVPPTVPWRVFFSDIANEPDMELACSILSEGKLDKFGNCVFIPSIDGGDNITFAIQEFIAFEYINMCKNYVIVQKTLSELRQVHERVQNDFAALEKHVSSLGHFHCELLFENLPIAALEKSLQTCRTISQLLPVPGDKISAIQFYIEVIKAGDFADGIWATITNIEDNVDIVKEFIPQKALKSGWITIYLPRYGFDQHRSFGLNLQLEGHNLEVSLFRGLRQPLDSFKIKCAHDEIIASKYSLAMRIWSSLKPMNDAALEVEEKKLIEGVRVLEKQLSPFELINFDVVMSDWQPDFDIVKYHTSEQAVECHPPPQGITFGSLEIDYIDEPFIINATCSINGDRSAPIDFCISVISQQQLNDVKDEKIGIDKILGDTSFSSGWVTIGVHQIAVLTAVHVPHFDEKSHVLIATRMHERGANSHAWARFRKFVIRHSSS